MDVENGKLEDLAGAVSLDFQEQMCLHKIEANAASLLMLVRTGIENKGADWYSIWALSERIMGLAEEGGCFEWEPSEHDERIEKAVGRSDGAVYRCAGCGATVGTRHRDGCAEDEDLLSDVDDVLSDAFWCR